MPNNFLDFHPKQNEVESLKKIWKDIFKDKDTIIDSFFKNIYKPEQTLLIREDGQPVSVIYLLDSHVSILNKEYPAFYIYAAATKEEYRSRGHMARLLDLAKSFALACEKDLLCLFPAEKSLYDYYKKFGYEPLFKTKEVAIKGTSVRALMNKTIKIQDLQTSDFYKIRSMALKNTDALLWSEDILEFQKELLDEYEGRAYLAMQNNEAVAYVVGYRGENKTIIKEALSVNGNFSAIAAILHEKFNLEDYVLPLPVNFQLSSDNMTLADGGMALALTDEAKSIKERINNLYMGINLG